MNAHSTEDMVGVLTAIGAVLLLVAVVYAARRIIKREDCMFTGIVEEMGAVMSLEKTLAGTRMTILASLVMGDLKIGDSVSANGTCLTVVTKDERNFIVEVSPETLSVTTLGHLDLSRTLLRAYHSHPHSDAYPSTKDISLAFYPDSLYVIVTLVHEEPLIRTFEMKAGIDSQQDGIVKEVEIFII